MTTFDKNIILNDYFLIQYVKNTSQNDTSDITHVKHIRKTIFLIANMLKTGGKMIS